ncbi:hypothetical protein [Rhodovulum marinum]|uniref:Uncharacterized protein n=1 Tax=Rhodovulum marinum TaxID=320662 RepID=A0A4R2Q5J8_9RHOB|nr:hypothetical protein [Rhodovulum marinum]TCP43224.1 hypothetical protein EV662_102421 [Rhodovulum marinum]
MVEVPERPASPEECPALRQVAGVSGFRLAFARGGPGDRLFDAWLRAGGRLADPGAERLFEKAGFAVRPGMAQFP